MAPSRTPTFCRACRQHPGNTGISWSCFFAVFLSATYNLIAPKIVVSLAVTGILELMKCLFFIRTEDQVKLERSLRQCTSVDMSLTDISHLQIEIYPP